MRSALSYLWLPLLSIPASQAWGGMGHETVAFIASSLVTTETAKYCQDLLSDTSSSYLASVAPWADTFRYTKAGRFSAPYHFIDAKDDPPHSCGVDFERDCGKGGCVVQAIQNYTTRIQDTSLSQEDRFEALKFVIHFVGDVHQPLHDENLDLGGNDVEVTFGGTKTNLHHIWDTNMLEKYTGGSDIQTAQDWASKLTQSIQSGDYSSQAASWLSGIDVTDPITTSMGWASDSNAYVCSTVLPDGVDVLDGAELDGDYYTSAIPVFELQIAKAGYRLAAWLNLIATGSVGLTHSTATASAIAAAEE
ncbi:MAG: hypothetical protein M1838_000056 [Thelocarpon superellum]|nr:MAG: hypothetical protein M1838_000056 [Thelocarpon superellum]